MGMRRRGGPVLSFQKRSSLPPLKFLLDGGKGDQFSDKTLELVLL